MQNQCFGDVNDYQKYGLLRFLANAGQHKIGVCWMLTADEGRPNGQLPHYLDQPKAWRDYDPELFDWLGQWAVTQQPRDVMLLTNSQALPGAKFYSAVLTDALRERQAYFKRLRGWLTACDLIFYDPGRGIETPSCPKGRQHSAKYVYWDELRTTFANGSSVLVGQRFRREERACFIQQMLKEYQVHLPASQVYWFRTQQVVYFLSVQAQHLPYLATRVQALSAQWADKIQVGIST